MSKVFKIFILTFFLLSFFILLPMQVFASEDCSAAVSGNITYEPKTFPPPTGNLTLNFTINNVNAHNLLKGRPVRLHYIVPLSPGIGDYNTPEVTIPTDRNTFSIPLTGDSKMVSPGDHEAVLDLNQNEYCKGIKYTVGDANVCVIDPTLQSTIPPFPNNVFPLVKFSGKPNTKYYLFISGKNDLACSTRTPCTPITDIDTDSSGQRAFPNVEIQGSVGETKIIKLGINNFQTNCSSKEIQISASASPPGTPAPGPVATPPPGTTAGSTSIICPGDPSCSIAKGKPCGDPQHPEDPAIATAIGCIHTSPIGFTQDILKFAVAISGGIAFLMMIMGAFQMLTSSGNPETLKGGQDRLTSAIVGLLIVILAVILLRFIGVDILGILPV